MADCFVIGPIGDKFAPPESPARQAYEDALDVLEKVIEPACEAQGLTPIRADQIAASGDINEQVFRRLRDDEVVIADVSNGNANVMYELGARHVTGKLTIQIGEYGQLPFDISAIRTIQFSRSRRGLIDARNDLIEALAVGLTQEPDVLPVYRVWFEKGTQLVAVKEGDREESLTDANGEEEEDDDGAGLLENMLLAEQAMPELRDIIEQIGTTMEEIGEFSFEAGEEAEAAAERSGSANARLVVIGKFAKQLDEPTSRLDELTKQYESKLSEINTAMVALIDFFAQQDPDSIPDNQQEFVESLSSMAESSREGMEGINSFGASAMSMGALSKRLRVPGRRIRDAVKRMADATASVDEWERRLSPLREKLAQKNAQT